MRSLTLFVATTAVVAGCVSCGGSSKSSNAAPATSRPTSSPAGASPRGTPAHPSAGTPTTPPAPARSLPVGGPVPTGFQPASVTFVSHTEGYVLGEPPTCASPPCTSLVRTTDAGAHWVGVPAPRTPGTPAADPMAGGDPASVTDIRFADPYNGWAYGPGLWVTHDAARTWHSINVGGHVMALAAGGGRVDAIVVNCAGGADCPGSPARLLSSPTNSDSFTQVAEGTTGLSATGPFGGAAVSLHSPAGFALLGRTSATTLPSPAIIRATSNGSRWTTFPDPCSSVSGTLLSSIDAPDVTSLVSLCTGEAAAGSTAKTMVVTRHGINTVTGHPPAGGDGGLIAANGQSTVLVSSVSAASFLYRSTDSGAHWTTQQFNDGGTGLHDLGFTTGSQAVVIHGEPVIANNGGTPSELLMTIDAGASWRHVNF